MARPVAQDPTSRGTFTLVRRLGPATWLARTDGDLVAVRPALATSLQPASPGLPAPEASTRLTRLRAPQLVPLLGVAERDGRTWLLSEYVPGACVQRLLTVATLTPVQAAYLAAEVLAGVSCLHEAGLGHGHLVAANMLVGEDGVPRLTDWALRPSRPPGELRGADLAGARTLIVDLARNADRPVVQHRGRYDALLASLERVGLGGAPVDAALAEVNTALDAALGQGKGAVIARAELAALVRALAQRTPPDSTSGERGGPSRTAASATSTRHERTPPGLLPQADWRSPPRRRATWWMVAALCAVLLAAVGYAVARKPIGSVADRLLHRQPTATHASSPPARSPAPRPAKPAVTHPVVPRPVPTFAPASAAPVAGLTIRALVPCRPGASCVVKVTVQVASPPTTLQLPWRIVVVNRCTGSTAAVHDGVLTVRPGWSHVYATPSVQLPAASSLAVIAMTESPVRAASPPLPVPSGGGRC